MGRLHSVRYHESCHCGQTLAQSRQARASLGTDKDSRDPHAVHFKLVFQFNRLVIRVQCIHLVEYQELGYVICTDFLEHLLYFRNLFGAVGIGCINHVQKQVGVHRLLQGRLKGVYQTVRQIANKPHGVLKGHGTTGITQVELPSRGVQGGKQLVCGIGARLDQGIEQR